MRVLDSPAAVAAACPDPLVRWAAQSLLPGRGGTAWAHGDAVGVRAPALNRHDRLVLAGPVEDVAVVLRAHRHGLDALVVSELAAPLVGLVAGTAEHATFGWMERTGELAVPGGVGWLRVDEWDDVEALLRKASPHSYVWPHEPGPTRWAGVRLDGELIAVGADAWSAPGVGFVAGVATHPDYRGRGLSKRVCSFLTGHLLAEHGTCALMVDKANAPAKAVYRGLGFHYRSVTALRDEAHS